MSGHPCSQSKRGRKSENRRERWANHRSRPILRVPVPEPATSQQRCSGLTSQGRTHGVYFQWERFSLISLRTRISNFVVTDVPWLLDRLRASGAKTATAEFDVYCTWRGKVAGFSIRTVNGNAIPGQAGGWSGWRGTSPA